MGEPFFIPIWKETALKLLERDNVVSLAAVSNLSMDIEAFFDKADPAKVGIMASLHPTEFKNHDEDFEAFLRRLKTLRDIGVSLVVNYVLTPDQVHLYPKYRSSIFALDIPMTSNVLRGPFRGKIYPEAFTDDEMAIVKLCYDENSYIFDSQSHYRNPYGLECVSGRVGFYLEYDGSLYNCHFARQKIGSVYDEKLMARTQNGYCTATKCESQTTIGWQAEIALKFGVQRTMHHYVRKTD
jgi:MoaA/NifB/PqqE/SkfB family radical SAM enzyme